MTNIYDILCKFSESYLDKTAEVTPLSFGIVVNEDRYLISIESDKSYTIKPNENLDNFFCFVTDIETIYKIYKGEMNAMTAMARACWTDKTPLDFRNHQYIPKDINIFNFVFRYFSIGQPEIIKLGKEHSRIVHGGYSIPIIYNPGLRTAWYRVEKGMFINEKEDQKMNPFDTLIIVIKGYGEAELGEEIFKVEIGNAYYIPEGMKHSFWTNNDDGLEFIIIMFGEGA